MEFRSLDKEPELQPVGLERKSRSVYRDYTLRRLLKLPLVLLAVSVIVFGLSRMGGSPVGIYLHPGMSEEQVEEIYERYHLDDSLPEQYFIWLRSLLQGDLGYSGVSAAPVSDVIWRKISSTLELGAGAAIVAIIFGVGLGTFGGSRREKLGDHGTRVVSSMGASLPDFWFALLALYVGFLVLGIAPLGRFTPEIWNSIPHPTGFYTLDSVLALSTRGFVDAVYHLWLPVAVLGFIGTAEIARFMRSSLVEELGSEYVDSARARGLKKSQIVRRHARRNALLPTITMAGVAFAGILQGAVVIEIIFQLPGMGSWIAQAMLRGDQATVMASVMVIAVGISVVYLVVDLAYAHFDPRISLDGAGQ